MVKSSSRVRKKALFFGNDGLGFSTNRNASSRQSASHRDADASRTAGFLAYGIEFRGFRRRRPIGSRFRSRRAANEPVFWEHRQTARRRRAFRRGRSPMRQMFSATIESATARAQPSAPYASTRSRPRCPRLLIADSTAGYRRRLAENSSPCSRSRCALSR